MAEYRQFWSPSWGSTASWIPEDPELSRQKAEGHQKRSPLGYLYRLAWCSNSQSVRVAAFRILSQTPATWTIGLDYEGDKTLVVREQGFVRFAHPTIKKALDSYLRRRRAWISRLETQLRKARDSLEKAEVNEARREFELFLYSKDRP